MQIYFILLNYTLSNLAIIHSHLVQLCILGPWKGSQIEEKLHFLSLLLMKYPLVFNETILDRNLQVVFSFLFSSLDSYGTVCIFINLLVLIASSLDQAEFQRSFWFRTVFNVADILGKGRKDQARIVYLLDIDVFLGSYRQG